MIFVFSLYVTSVHAAFDQEIHSKYKKLPRDEFVEYFNSLNLTWTIKKSNKDEQHHGPCSYVEDMTIYPVSQHDLRNLNLPETFDAREKWPQCTSISMIYDQKNCGACWAFGTATTAGDRSCIHANIHIKLSEQDLSCCTDCFDKYCTGGAPGLAFQHWIDKGLVTYDCMPYDTKALLNNTACTKSCVNGVDYKSDKNYGGRVYSVSSEEDQIKAELYRNGPIEVVFNVFKDLYDYHKGVYVHKYGDKQGLHSVRLIGYGEENGLKYWLMANSWGKDLGEKGFYKIKRYQPELKFENDLLAAMPKGH